MIQRECDNDLLVKLDAFCGVCINNYHFPGDSSFLVRPQVQGTQVRKERARGSSLSSGSLAAQLAAQFEFACQIAGPTVAESRGIEATKYRW